MVLNRVHILFHFEKTESKSWYLTRAGDVETVEEKFGALRSDPDRRHTRPHARDGDRESRHARMFDNVRNVESMRMPTNSFSNGRSGWKKSWKTAS